MAMAINCMFSPSCPLLRDPRQRLQRRSWSKRGLVPLKFLFLTDGRNIMRSDESRVG